MAPHRVLTPEDFEGIEFTGDKFRTLVACCARALEILEADEAAERQRQRQRQLQRQQQVLQQHEKRKKDKEQFPSQAPPSLPEQFKNTVIQRIARGRDVANEKLVIQKALFETDLRKTQNRLSIPINRIVEDFLSNEEKEHLDSRDERGYKKFMAVKIVDPALRVEDVKLCRWDMGKENGNTSSSYMINGTWWHIADRNRLQVGTVVQLWALRVEGELCFALVRLPEPEESVSSV